MNRIPVCRGSRAGPAAKQRYRSQLDFGALLRTSQACFLTLCPQGMITEWSLQLGALLDFAPEEACHVKFIDFITVDFHNDVTDMIGKAQAVGHFSKAVPIYTKEGAKINTVLHAFASAQTMELGHEVHIVVQPSSISAETCKSKSMWMQLEMPISELDLSDKVTEWNQHMVELFGFSAHDMVGRSFYDITTVDTTKKVQRMLKVSKETVGVSTCRVTLHTISGIPQLVRLYATAGRDGAGQIMSISLAVQKIVDGKTSYEIPSVADLPTTDALNDIVSDTSEESAEEWECNAFA